MSDSISSLCLVRECKELHELEELCGVAFTDKMLEENWCGRTGVLLLDRCGVRAPLIAGKLDGQDCGVQL